MHFNRLFLILFSIFNLPIAFQAMGQVFNDTLPSFELKAFKSKTAHSEPKTEWQVGQTKDSFELKTLDQYRHLSVATLISQQSPAFVKTYGVNSLATLSLRGASAAQSLVLWKGVPIANAGLGSTDISVLQTGLFNKVQVLYGGNAALLGSGNVGGALLLDQEWNLNTAQRYTLEVAKGAFGKKEVNLSANWRYKNLSAKVQGFHHQMNNEFLFTDLDGSEQRMDHAQVKASGALAQIKVQTTKRSELTADIWYQKYQRQIPRALFESLSSKEQTDGSLKTLIQYRNKHEFGDFSIKSSFIKDDIDYSDVAYQVFQNNASYQLFNEISWRKSFTIPFISGTHQTFINVPFQFQWININQAEIRYQSKPALTAAYQYTNPNQKLSVQANVRQEWLNGEANPFLLGAGLGYALVKRPQLEWSLLANIQKTYRVPSLSELYSFPGGNVNLKPEQGWNRELGYKFKFSSSSSHFQVSQTVSYFDRDIKDWIYWLGGAIWTPYNLARVHNRGLETFQKVTGSFNPNTQWHLGLKTAYILSTTTASYMPNDGSIGKQIPYAPRYSGNINAGVEYKNLYFNYNHQYTGYRFVTTDESQYLLPYHTGNIQLDYKFAISNDFSSKIGLQIQNVFNKDYQVVAFRPMPRRHWVLQWQIQIF